jgi:hypothetical protein
LEVLGSVKKTRRSRMMTRFRSRGQVTSTTFMARRRQTVAVVLLGGFSYQGRKEGSGGSKGRRRKKLGLGGW